MYCLHIKVKSLTEEEGKNEDNERLYERTSSGIYLCMESRSIGMGVKGKRRKKGEEVRGRRVKSSIVYTLG